MKKIAQKKNRHAWCFLLYAPFCKQLKDFTSAMEKAQVISNGTVHYGMINCQADSSLCESLNKDQEDYPLIVFYNRTKHNSFQEPLNPKRIAHLALKLINNHLVQTVDDFWIDDYREKPTAIFFSSKNKPPSSFAALSRSFKKKDIRFGFCNEDSLANEMGVKQIPSLVFFNKTHTIFHEGQFFIRYMKESTRAFIEGRESNAPVEGSFFVNSQLPEICYDYSVSCVFANDNFIDPKVDEVRIHFKNDPFKFFVGTTDFPFKGIPRGGFAIYNAKKEGIIIVKDVEHLTAALDRVLDGGAKYSPQKPSVYTEL